MPKLKNKRHELLVQEYLIDLNQTQAAIRAGYSPKTANEQASRLFANVNIRARVDELMAERSKRTGVNADRVLFELARLGLINAADVINMDSATIKSSAARDDTAAIASVKVKIIPSEDGNIVEREIKLYDKNKSLELLGKHLGLFTDKLELSGKLPLQVVIEDDYGDNDYSTSEMESGISGG